MTSNEELRKGIMRRVYITHTLRTILSPFAIKLYIFVVLLWQVLMRVSVLHVFSNAKNASGFGAFKFYILTAFSKTEFLVQVSIFITLALAIWMVRDIFTHHRTRIA